MEGRKTESPKYCVNCSYYSVFYTKTACSFYKEKKGFCYRLQKMSTNREVCDGWERKRTEYARGLHRRSAEKVLKEMLSEIEQIRQMLKGDEEEP